MGVEFLQHTADGILHEFLLVYGVDIEVVDIDFGHLQFLQGLFVHIATLGVHTQTAAGCQHQG